MCQKLFFTLYHHFLTYLTFIYSYNHIKIIFIKKTSFCICHFEENWCRVARATLRNSKSKSKLRSLWLLFPDCLSVFYDMTKINTNICCQGNKYDWRVTKVNSWNTFHKSAHLGILPEWNFIFINSEGFRKKYPWKTLKLSCHIKLSSSNSAVSKAILNPVYGFGIPNSDPQTLKSVNFWCNLSSPFIVAEPREQCFELIQNAKYPTFSGVSPLNATGADLQRPPDSPTTQRFFSSLRLPKNRTPKKLLGTALSCPLSCGLFFKSHCHCLIVSCSAIDIKIILSHSCAGYNDTLSHQQYAQRKK